MSSRIIGRYTAPGFAITVSLYLYMAWRSSSISTDEDNHIPDQEVDPLPIGRVLQQDWQPVSGSRHKFAIYSAYSVIDRSPSQVLIIGITKKLNRDKFSCQFNYPAETRQSNSLEAEDEESTPDKNIVRASIEVLKPGSEGSYAGVFIRCPLPTSSKTRRKTVRPEMVSVILNEDEAVSNMLKIQYQSEDESTPYQHNFSVCVKPTFNFNQVFPLLEWIEFYKLMGVQQFTLYNMTIGPEASCVLRQLMKGSDPSIKMNVLPWRNYHILNSSQITGLNNVPQYSIAAAQNDCVYRHRGHYSKYMIFVDLDEFIMPREEKARNYHEMIDLLDSQYGRKKSGEYEFRNAFYIMSRPDDPQLQDKCSSYERDPLKHSTCLGSLLLRKVSREDFYPYKSRSKYIIRPEGVRVASNHFVATFEKGWTSLKVAEDIGFSRHYRHFSEANHSVIDGVTMEFGGKLVDNLSKNVEALRKMCNFTLDFSE